MAVELTPRHVAAIALLREQHELLSRGEFVHACVRQGCHDTLTIDLAYAALAAAQWKPLAAADLLERGA